MLTRDLLAVANLLVKLSREEIGKLTVWLTNTDSNKRQHPCTEVHGPNGFRRVWSLWVKPISLYVRNIWERWARRLKMGRVWPSNNTSLPRGLSCRSWSLLVKLYMNITRRDRTDNGPLASQLSVIQRHRMWHESILNMWACLVPYRW